MRELVDGYYTALDTSAAENEAIDAYSQAYLLAQQERQQRLPQAKQNIVENDDVANRRDIYAGDEGAYAASYGDYDGGDGGDVSPAAGGGSGGMRTPFDPVQGDRAGNSSSAGNRSSAGNSSSASSGGGISGRRGPKVRVQTGRSSSGGSGSSRKAGDKDGQKLKQRHAGSREAPILISGTSASASSRRKEEEQQAKWKKKRRDSLHSFGAGLATPSTPPQQQESGLSPSPSQASSPLATAAAVVSGTGKRGQKRKQVQQPPPASAALLQSPPWAQCDSLGKRRRVRRSDLAAGSSGSDVSGGTGGAFGLHSPLRSNCADSAAFTSCGGKLAAVARAAAASASSSSDAETPRADPRPLPCFDLLDLASVATDVSGFTARLQEAQAGLQLEGTRGFTQSYLAPSLLTLSLVGCGGMAAPELVDTGRSKTLRLPARAATPDGKGSDGGNAQQQQAKRRRVASIAEGGSGAAARFASCGEEEEDDVTMEPQMLRLHAPLHPVGPAMGQPAGSGVAPGQVPETERYGCDAELRAAMGLGAQPDMGAVGWVPGRGLSSARNSVALGVGSDVAAGKGGGGSGAAAGSGSAAVASVAAMQVVRGLPLLSAGPRLVRRAGAGGRD